MLHGHNKMNQELFASGERLLEVEGSYPFWNDTPPVKKIIVCDYRAELAPSRAKRMARFLSQAGRLITGWPYWFFHLFISEHFSFRSVRSELLKKKQNPKDLLMALAQRKAHEVRNHVWMHITSLELWVGIVSGFGARVTTKLIIFSAFAPTHGAIVAALSFGACAGAGFTAGSVAHLVRTRYRNSQIQQGARREHYFSKSLLSSAALGLFGGTLGGYAMNSDAVMARANSFAVGAITGLVASAVHLGLQRKKATDSRRKSRKWKKLALEGAALGAIGGVLGVLSVDVFGASNSVAATADQMDPLLAVPPTADPHFVAPPSLVPPPSAQIIITPTTPLQSITIMPQETMPGEICPIDKPPVMHHAMHHHRCHPVKHIKHAKHIAPPKPQPPAIIENIYVMPEPQPPQVIAPPPPPTPPMDPCEELCGTPCDPRGAMYPPRNEFNSPQGPYNPPQGQFPPHQGQYYPPQNQFNSPQSQFYQPQNQFNPPPRGDYAPQQGQFGPAGNGMYSPRSDLGPSQNSPDPTLHSALDLNGPCADPNKPCVERVSFNDDGDATKVVLEPKTSNRAGAYFEAAPQTTASNSMTSWKNATRNVTVASNNDSMASKVSLVVPFTYGASDAVVGAGSVG